MGGERFFTLEGEKSGLHQATLLAFAHLGGRHEQSHALPAMTAAVPVVIPASVPGMPLLSQLPPAKPPGIIPKAFIPQHAVAQAVPSSAVPNIATSAIVFAGVRKGSDDPEELQIHFIVPNSFVGGVIGPQGAFVQNTAVNTGCRIVVNKNSDDSQMRSVVIIGKHANVVNAQKSIHHLYSEAAAASGVSVDIVRVIFCIRADLVGFLIGKGAQGLKRIREQSGTKLTVRQDETHNHRPCIIEGELSNVLEAERLIVEVLMETMGLPMPSTNAAVSSPRPTKRPGAEIHRPVQIAEVPPLKRVRVEGGAESNASQTKLLVPMNSAGKIIGKQGSGLKEIRESCGIQLEVLQLAQTPYWPNERVVILHGPTAGRQHALETICNICFAEAPDAASLRLLLPERQAAVYIGKAGCNMKQMSENSGIQCKVDKNIVRGDRLLQATGNLHQVTTAAAFFHELSNAIESGMTW